MKGEIYEANNNLGTIVGFFYFFQQNSSVVDSICKGLHFHMSNPSPVIWNNIEFSYNLRTKYVITNDDIAFVDVIAEPRGSATALKLEQNGWVDLLYSSNNSNYAINSLAKSFIQDGYEVIKHEDMVVLGNKRTFLVLQKNNDYLAHAYIPEKKIILHYAGEPSGYDYFKYIFKLAKVK